METINLKSGGTLRIYRNYLDQENANTHMNYLMATMPWQRSSLMLYGKPCQTPRYQCWMGDANVAAEVYSKNRVDWDDTLLSLKNKLESDLDFQFNYLLLNLYKTGSDYISYHSDSEVLADTDLIASVSLGEKRRFLVKRWDKNQTTSDPETYELILNTGDMVVMDGLMQRYYKHSVPKTAKDVDSRINLTWRKAKVLN